METWKKIILVMIVSIIFFAPGLVKASSVYNAVWDPPNVVVDAAHPYYFPMWLPDWDFKKGDYSEAMFELTYYNQCGLDIFIFAADPSTDTSDAQHYDILLGKVPYTVYNGSGTAQFDLLATLSNADFDALFQDQSILYLVADCHYVFDKVSLHLEANNVPIPSAVWLLASGFIGLAGVRRKLAKA